jgi:hypothetical protein
MKITDPALNLSKVNFSIYYSKTAARVWNTYSPTSPFRICEKAVMIWQGM